MSPFDVIKEMTYKKSYRFDDEVKSAYVPFIINKSLSFNVESIMFANEMNLNSEIDDKLQYDYYFYSLRKKSYYGKFIGKKDDKDLKLVQQYFNLNARKAEQALKILTNEQIKAIRKKLE